MKEISALDLRKRFGEIIDEVRYRKEPWMVKKNGRPVIVLMDVEAYQAAQDNLREEAFIEEYTAERIKEFLGEDQLDRASVQAVQKSLS